MSDRNPDTELLVDVVLVVVSKVSTLMFKVLLVVNSVYLVFSCFYTECNRK